MANLKSVSEKAETYRLAYDKFRAEVKAAQEEGFSDVKIAQAAGVSVQTVRSWTGKVKPRKA